MSAQKYFISPNFDTVLSTETLIFSSLIYDLDLFYFLPVGEHYTLISLNTWLPSSSILLSLLPSPSPKPKGGIGGTLLTRFLCYP
jgi:hypothetical protein